MVHNAIENRQRQENHEELRNLVTAHTGIFRTSFSSRPTDKMEPMKIDLTPDAKPVRVRLWNYSLEQRAFLCDFVAKLVLAGMAYFNPSSTWEGAPLLVPKPGPAQFRFTVDIRPVNRFPKRHQFPLPIIGEEL